MGQAGSTSANSASTQNPQAPSDATPLFPAQEASVKRKRSDAMSSLFSNLNDPNKKPATSSLFGASSNATSAQTGGSLFGTAPASSRPQSQPQQPGGIFSNLNTSQVQQSQPQQAGSLFSNLNNNAPKASTGSSLFGNAQAQSQPQQKSQPASTSGSGFFGSNPTTSSGGGGLFGNTTTTTSGGLFGNQQPAAASGGGLFGNSTAQQSTNQQQGGPQLGRSQQQPAGPQGPLAQGATGPLRSTYFDSLLDKGKKRNQENGLGQFGDLPSLQLGLGDIARKVRNLGQGGPTAGRGRDSKAHYLLAASGVSTGSTLRDLNAFSAQTGTPATKPSLGEVDTDIEGYLSNLQAQSTVSLIAEGLEQAKRDFDNFLEEHVQMEWDAQRRRIYEHFGLVKQSDDVAGDVGMSQMNTERGAFGRSSRRSKMNGASTMRASNMSFGASGMARSIIGTPSMRGSVRSPTGAEGNTLSPKPIADDRFSREKQEKFAHEVTQLNMARLQDFVWPVLHHFSDVEAQSGTDTAKPLVDAYKALIEITGEDVSAQRLSDPGAIRERQYMSDYLDELPNSKKSIAIKKRILAGSRRFMEKSFWQHVENTVARNPAEAAEGGIPSKQNTVRAYIRVRIARKDLDVETHKMGMNGENGDYYWAMVYYMIRCGLFDDAAQYVSDNAKLFRIFDRNFPAYVTSYAKSEDRRLTADLQTTITGSYLNRKSDQADPYCIACFKVLGRCELAKKNLDEINQGVEDWIWVQFALAREVNRTEEAAGETYGLDEVKALIQEVGARHFGQGGDAPGGHGIYFFMQILCGAFEPAVNYLYNHNYTSAVHFAIGLDYYGLLRVSNMAVSGMEILSFTTKEQPQLNFARMVGVYTSEFRQGRTETAADYLILLCLNADLPGEAGKAQASICHEALRELVLETREFAQLLGDVRLDGQRVKGAIEQRLKLIKLADQQELLRVITIQAASIADDSGRTTDAVLLYHLADDYDSVVSIINRALSEAVAIDLGQAPLRLEPLKPRADEPTNPSQPQPPQPNTLSLTAIENPEQLAKTMVEFYDSNASYYSKIKPQNRQACLVLLRISEAKRLVEASRWPEAIDVIAVLNLLPLHARGNTTLIRSAAQNFNTLPPTIARNVGNLLIWTIHCCSQQRAILLGGAFEDNSRRQMAEDLRGMAQDCMVFAGLVKYKLEPRVFDALARAGTDGA